VSASLVTLVNGEQLEVAGAYKLLQQAFGVDLIELELTCGEKRTLRGTMIGMVQEIGQQAERAAFGFSRVLEGAAAA